MDGASGRPPVNSPSQSRASTHDGSSHAVSLPVRACRRGVLSVVEIWCSFSEAYSKGLTCCVVGAPTRSPLGPAWGAPRPPESGALLPRAIERDRFAAPCRAESESESAERDETLPPDPLRIFRRPGATRVRPCSPPLPPGPDSPSTRAVLAARWA